MQVVRTVAELRMRRTDLPRGKGGVLGFVPTMGALHAGHRSLVARARAECDVVAVSIFVNPLQFAAGEDLDRYPRTFEADCALLRDSGVDVLFAPGVEEMYPAAGTQTVIHVEGIEDRLDGVSRPGHFAGVATVVAKLFQMVAPDRAYFGQKDAAQLAVLRRMVRDLNFDLELVGCPIVRDPDGLAMSSRNRYLTADERVRALVLSRTLESIERQVAQGERAAVTLVREAVTFFARTDGVVLEYLAIVDPDTLLPVAAARPGTLVSIAAKVGGTRLIDNFLVGA